MRGLLVVVVALAACGGGGSGSTTCAPPGPDDNVWPPGCDTFDCHDQVCDVTCDYMLSDPICERLDCTGSPQCRVDCQQGRTCPDLDCTGAASCFLACEIGASCEGTCIGAHACSVACGATSQCLLHCGPAGMSADCRMDGCPTTPTDCGGGVYACNRACP